VGYVEFCLVQEQKSRADQQEESRHWDDTPVRLRELWSVATSVELSEGQTWPCAAIAVF